MTTTSVTRRNNLIQVSPLSPEIDFALISVLFRRWSCTALKCLASSKMRLAQWRAKKAKRERGERYYGGVLKGRPRSVFPERLEAGFRDERMMTRVMAALLHNVPISTISRDLHIPRRAVAIIAMRERQL